MAKRLLTEYLVVNSADRQREPVHRFGKMIILPENSVTIRSSPSDTGVTVMHVSYSPELADLSLRDSIVLENVRGKVSIVSRPFSVKMNSLYLRVHHPAHGQIEQFGSNASYQPIARVEPPPRGYSVDQDFIDSTQYYILPNPSIPLTVQITASGTAIDPGWLQKPRRAFLIYLKTGDEYQHDPNSYLLRLDQPSAANYSDLHYQGAESRSVSVSFNSLQGLPLMNGSIGTETSLVVTAVRPESFLAEIRLPSSVGNKSFVLESQVILKKIIGIDPAYPDANHWRLTLPRTIKKVEKVQVISSIFPNSQRVIDTHNSELIWRVEDTVYRGTITPGNYSPALLAKSISEMMTSQHPSLKTAVQIDPATSRIRFAVTRSSRDIVAEHIPERIDSGGSVYQIEKRRSSARLYHRGSLELEQSVVVNWTGQEPVSVNSLTLLQHFSYNHYLMTLQWQDGGLKTNDLIVTDQFYDPLSKEQRYIYRVAEVMNGGMFRMEAVDDITVDYAGMRFHSRNMPTEMMTQEIIGSFGATSYYDIFLPGAAPDIIQVTDPRGRGARGKLIQSTTEYFRVQLSSALPEIKEVEVPVRIQLIRSERSVMKALGIGTTESLYEVSIITPALRLSGEDCLYVLSKELSTIPARGEIQNIFQIINWHHPPGTVCYDAHLPMSKTFYPSAEISSIDISLVNPDGSPYQLNGFDYQMVLEVSHY